jgi:hypothetical protein
MSIVSDTSGCTRLANEATIHFSALPSIHIRIFVGIFVGIVV